MHIFYVHLRTALTWIILAVLSAVLGEFAIQFLQSRGVFRNPFWVVGAAMNAIVAVRDFPGFWTSIIACAAFLVGMWADTIARKIYRRTSRTGSQAAVKRWITPREAIRLWADPQLIELAKAAAKIYSATLEEMEVISKRIDASGNGIDNNAKSRIDKVEAKLNTAAYLKAYRNSDIDIDFRNKLFERKIPTRGKRVKKDGSLGSEIKIDPSLWLTFEFEEGDENMQSVRLGTIERFKEVTLGLPDEIAES